MTSLARVLADDDARWSRVEASLAEGLARKVDRDMLNVKLGDFPHCCPQQGCAICRWVEAQKSKH